MPEQLKPPPYLPQPADALLGEAIQDLMAAHEVMKAGAKCPGIPTGLPTLDRNFGGLQEGMFLLGAAPGVGKTRLALAIARNAAKEGFPVLYLTADEGARRLALRLACMDAGIKLSDLTSGKDPTNLQNYRSTNPQMLKRINIMEAHKVDPASLGEQLADRIKQAGSRMGLLVVDYVQALASTYNMEMRQAVGQIAVDIRAAAVSCKSPALVISAISRAGYKDPNMANLRETSDLEYSADGVWMIREDENAPVSPPMQALILGIEKNRWGAKGIEVPLVVDASIGTIAEKNR